MAAIRLCNDDAYLAKVSANITEITEVKGGYSVTLDRTIFHPKGGGQPADRGSIGGIEIMDVKEAEGEVYHILKSRPEVGEVECLLDYEYRYDLMQQHTGQHILSTVIENLYDSDTTIYRGEEEICQIDLSKPLTEEQIEKAERMTNDIIKKALPVRGINITKADIPQYEGRMRHPVHPHEVIRLVEIADFDLIGCGGSHVKDTSEVGFLKVLYHKNIEGQKGSKGAMRLYFVCGDRAIADYTAQNDIILKGAKLLSCERAAFEKRLEEIIAAYDRLTAKAATMTERLLSYDTEALLRGALSIGGVTFVSGTLNGTDGKGLKTLAERVAIEHDAMALLMAIEGDVLSFVFSQKKGLTDIKMGDLLKDVMSKANGKGGGSQIMAQGSSPYSEEAIRAFEEAVKAAQDMLS